MKATIKGNDKRPRILQYIKRTNVQVTSRDCPMSDKRCNNPECISGGCLKVIN